MLDPTSLALAIADLEPLAVLGRGAKGVVFHVRTADGYYAFKATSRGGTHRRVWSERDVLQTLHHPLLPTLHGVAETETIVGFAMDWCSGGDLNALRHRQTEHMFTTDMIRFYAAELVLAVSYLHEHNIVYRDLKPENVMIQSSGHLMLVDFDLSIRLPRGAGEVVAQPPPPPPPAPLRRRRLLSCFSREAGVSPEDALVSSSCSSGEQLVKSNSFVGTEEYVAPEVIKGDGHDYSVDWWGLGVVLYEMLYGRTPFRGQNRKETFYRILSKEPELVGEPTPLRNLISRLLEKDPGLRISSAEIKSHEFFQGVDWELVTKVGRPPFISAEVELREDEGREAIDIEKVVHDIFGVKAKEGNWEEQVKTGDFSAF